MYFRFQAIQKLSTLMGFNLYYVGRPFMLTFLEHYLVPPKNTMVVACTRDFIECALFSLVWHILQAMECPLFSIPLAFSTFNHKSSLTFLQGSGGGHLAHQSVRDYYNRQLIVRPRFLNVECQARKQHVPF